MYTKKIDAETKMLEEGGKKKPFSVHYKNIFAGRRNMRGDDGENLWNIMGFFIACFFVVFNKACT